MDALHCDALLIQDRQHLMGVAGLSHTKYQKILKNDISYKSKLGKSVIMRRVRIVV